jgi:two-component system response regulator YesN
MRVLIVEDEKTTRELLRDFVPWAKLGFESVETAHNGLRALELLEAAEVDLVFTDVRMPKMDGVELAVETRRRYPDCVLVFLSGFSDTEYLRTAIRVQAQDYLDKPVDLAQVEDAAARAARMILGRKRSREESEREERALKELTPLRRQAQAQALFGAGPEPRASLEERFSDGPLRALVVCPSAARDPAAWAQAVLDAVNAEGFPFPSFVASLHLGGAVALACDRTLASDSAAFGQALEELLARISALDAEAEPRIGLAQPVSGPAELPRALGEAEAALSESFYKPERRICPYNRPSGRTFSLREGERDSLRSAMGQGDAESVLRWIERLEQRCLAFRDPDLARVRAAWLEAATLLLDWVPAWGPAERSSRAERLRRDMEGVPSLARAAEAVRDCFERLFVRPAGDLQVEDRMKKAKAYIETQFADPDLTVDAIAARVGLSESYFCTVFKQSVGSTVKDFVTSVRIERAKAYLWEKEPQTLADLAIKVGFRDPNYFGTVFKRLTGATPGAYRKRTLG